MSNTVVELFYKIVSLIKHLILIYSKPKLELLSIDNAKICENSLIQYIDNSTGKISYSTIKNIITDNIILNDFSSKDAELIGFYYGRIIAKNAASKI
jgi:hypothetical protein